MVLPKVMQALSLPRLAERMGLREPRVWYLGYGSNMDPQRLVDRDVPAFKVVPATLPDHELVFNIPSPLNTCGAANIAPAPGERVEGVLVQTTPHGLDMLDRFEGSHYDRAQVEVQLANGRTRKATAYVGKPEALTDGLKPSPEYLGRLLAGEPHLSDDYFEQLQKVETLPVDQQPAFLHDEG